jgi:hypothetical protein
MSKVAVSFLTKDRVDCTRRSVTPLLGASGGGLDIFWVDGSSPKNADMISKEYGSAFHAMFVNVHGGADAAIVYALTKMLENADYAFVGLCENDVLLEPTWYPTTMALFARGQDDGLEVGAVSARSYEDRLLIQRDGYGIFHNLGAGMVIFTRRAAKIILDHYRTGWTTENRQVFVQLTGLDIGAWWAFRGGEQPLTSDWSWDAILAKHGLASLALTPSLATMLDQDIAAQGLKMADGRMDLLRNDDAFDNFIRHTYAIRNGIKTYGGGAERLLASSNGSVVFPHQIPGIGGIYSGDWRLVNSQGWGPFGWKAGNVPESTDSTNGPPPWLEVPILGPCEFTVQGPGRFRVTDLASGYQIAPDLPRDRGVSQLVVPSGVSYRNVRIEALTPGCTFHGIQCRETQPWLSSFRFDHSSLPPV